MLKFPYRSHLSHEKFDILKVKDYTVNDTHWKPKGLWYSYRDGWYKFVSEGMPCRLEYSKHLYAVKLAANCFTTLDKPNPDKILRIKNIQEVRLFCERYFHRDGEKCNWNTLKKDYGGMEVRNVEKMTEGLSLLLCIPNWDIDSGSIWNLNLIRSMTYLGIVQQAQESVKTI